jgi:hypothetical protein
MKPAIFSEILLLLIIFSSSLKAQQNDTINPKETIRFVSFPDFFNFDIPEPWPGYDTAADYFLTQIKNEMPDFVLVAGDLVGGRWWDSPQCIQHLGTVYYSAWIRRMNRFGLKFYTAVGDHELGDDPWPSEKLKLTPSFEGIFRLNLGMPGNGPYNKKGLSYFVREGNLLLITVETFEVINDSMHVTVTGDQLEWFKKVLRDNFDAKFKIVQGHVPIWGEIKSRSSSRLILEGGKESEFYKVMKENGVDLYLAGEFHDVTILESDGIVQIVHGSSWGRTIVNTQDYLVGECNGNELKLTMKRIYMDADGEYMWNLNKERGPREIVRINQKTLINGPEITGTLTITNNDFKKTYTNRTGYFQ